MFASILYTWSLFIFKKSNCPDMQLGYKIQRKRKNRFILLMVHLYFKLSKQIEDSELYTDIPICEFGTKVMFFRTLLN